ncbi:hypothetical protein LR48_Vigan08g174700 [Vigna angularis]|uniref:Uncharacterized protein n=1 Tax=Phaseolus angularis TaxID=3914 RepID=A0A0L9V767_PHAAN|nr:hypothetical protein LR48_Vigan08g174700 [Vigna angularis]
MHHATCSDPPPSRACAPLVKMEVSEVNGGVQVSSRGTISISPPSLLNPSPSLFCNLPPLSPFTFQNRRNVRPTVIILLDRTELESKPLTLCLFLCCRSSLNLRLVYAMIIHVDVSRWGGVTGRITGRRKFRGRQSRRSGSEGRTVKAFGF